MKAEPSRREALAFVLVTLAAPRTLAAPNPPPRAAGDVVTWTVGVDGLAVLRLTGIVLPSLLPTTKPIRSSRSPLIIRYAWSANDPLAAWAERAKKNPRTETKTVALAGLDAATHPILRYALSKAIPAKMTLEGQDVARGVALELAYETMTRAG